MQQLLGRSSVDILLVPIEGGRSFTTAQRREINLSHKIRGWGSDLEPTVRPGVPMDKAPDLGIESLYPAIEPQFTRFLVHKSIEHGQMPPVFGNACPPRGLSGVIRGFAFGFSEGRLAHWLLLMVADRVDVVEQLVLDVASLQIPNIPAEMGIRAELKYNRAGFTKKVAMGGVGILAIGALVVLLKRRTAKSGARPGLLFPHLSPSRL